MSIRDINTTKEKINGLRLSTIIIYILGRERLFLFPSVKKDGNIIKKVGGLKEPEYSIRRAELLNMSLEEIEAIYFKYKLIDNNNIEAVDLYVDKLKRGVK